LLIADKNTLYVLAILDHRFAIGRFDCSGWLVSRWAGGKHGQQPYLRAGALLRFDWQPGCPIHFSAASMECSDSCIAFVDSGRNVLLGEMEQKVG
jgi:hypothetical protein